MSGTVSSGSSCRYDHAVYNRNAFPGPVRPARPACSPFEHGEVFVLNDGGEEDLDLGNYERFLDITLTRDHNITTGKMYNQVIQAERRGDYLGKTVQVIPHITDAIQDWIERVARLPVEAASSARRLKPKSVP